MRNSEHLDKHVPEDDNISELMVDENGREFRIVNGKKIYQIEEKTQSDKDHNLSINRMRTSGMSPWEYLNFVSKR